MFKAKQEQRTMGKHGEISLGCDIRSTLEPSHSDKIPDVAIYQLCVMHLPKDDRVLMVEKFVHTLRGEELMTKNTSSSTDEDDRS